MSEETWIDEAEKDELLRVGESSNDPMQLLKIWATNRDVFADQGRLLIACRLQRDASGFDIYGLLADRVEETQLVVDAQSRKDFMKVAIEQWQGKLANLKARILNNMENLT